MSKFYRSISLEELIVYQALYGEKVEFLRVRKSDDTYLFANKNNGIIHRSTINKVFNKYGNKIILHTLRHYFCTTVLEGGFSVHEVTYLAGHSNVHTTLLYLNGSVKTDMKTKQDIFDVF